MLDRRQPPVYSPLTLDALASGALSACRIAGDRRDHVLELLRRRFGAEVVTLCGSGTEALVLALRLAAQHLGASTLVALPAFSCFDVASAAVAADSPITFYDVDPGTLTPDLESLERRLGEGARIVVIAPLYGLPVDYDVLTPLMARYGALIIEDAAQGQGARWRGKTVGSFGHVSVLSFGRGKGWSAGCGGALLVRAAELASGLDGLLPEAARLSELRALITAGAQWAFGRPRLYSLPASLPWLGLGETRYRDAPSPGRLSRAAAPILERTLGRAENEAAIRRSNAEAFLSQLIFGDHVRAVRALAGAICGYLRLPIRLSRGIPGFADSQEALRLGIAASYPSPLTELKPVRARTQGPAGRWPGAEELARELVTLPTHSLLSARERTGVLRLVNSYLR